MITGELLIEAHKRRYKALTTLQQEEDNHRRKPSEEVRLAFQDADNAYQVIRRTLTALNKRRLP